MIYFNILKSKVSVRTQRVKYIDFPKCNLQYYFLEKNIGRIVTITSGLVCGGAPSRSPYVFTKYAAVGFLECLRYEMRRFGVHVSNFVIFKKKIFKRPNYFLEFHKINTQKFF